MLEEAARIDNEINLSEALASIIAHIVQYSPSLKHIDIGRILVCIASNKPGRRGGIYGKLVPLKFENGSEIVTYRGAFYKIPEISYNSRSVLYIVYFYIPRFFDLSWNEKLRVIFHELYHISPHFNGDIRRMGKIKTAHGHSKKRFDSFFMEELNNLLSHIQAGPYMGFLEMDTKSLFKRYKQVTGIRMKSPRPVVIKN